MNREPVDEHLDSHWEEIVPDKNDICPKCMKRNITMCQRLDFEEIYNEQPAEYSYKGHCNNCDANFEYPDTFNDDYSFAPLRLLQMNPCDNCEEEFLKSKLKKWNDKLFCVDCIEFMIRQDESLEWYEYPDV